MNKDAVTNHIDFHTGGHNNYPNETAALIIIRCYNGIKCIILITTGSQNDCFIKTAHLQDITLLSYNSYKYSTKYTLYITQY